MVNRPRAGFVLAASIAICFAMVVVALIVANKNRAMVGFARNTQAEALETETSGTVFAQLRGILQGNNAPSAVGLGALSAGTGNTFTLNTTVADRELKVTGKLLYTPDAPNSAGAEGYGTTQNAPGTGLGQPAIKVPTRASSAVLTASMGNEPTTNQYFEMYSANYPFALISVDGTVAARSVRSVTNQTASNVSALMAHVWAGAGVNITDGFNGHAYAPGSATTLHLPAAGGGVPHPNWTAPALPVDFAARLGAAQSSLRTGNDSKLESALEAMHDALHRNFSAANAAAVASHNIGPGVPTPPLTTATGGASVDQDTVKKSSMGDSDYDSLTGTLTLNTSLRIPANGQERLRFSRIDINGDLLLMDDTVLYLQGNLNVSGTIRLGQRASLAVDGSTNCGALSLTYGIDASHVSIRSMVHSSGPLTVTNAMNRSDNPLFTPITPEKRANPYPSSITMTYTAPGTPPTVTTENRQNEPLHGAYDTQAGLDFAAVIAKGLPQYLGSVTAAGSDTTDVPGVLVSTSRLSGGGSRWSGLFAGNDLTLTGVAVGAAWANNTLVCQDFRYFPYFTHAFVHTAGAAETPVGGVEVHPTAFGKYP